MRRSYGTIKDYHADDPNIRVTRIEFRGLDVSIVREPANDVRFARLARNAVVVDLDGSRRHLTELDGTTDETPTRPGQVMLVPAGAAVRLAWEPLHAWQGCVSIEFADDLFDIYVPEVLDEDFATGHLRPSHYAPHETVAQLAGLLARELDPARRRGTLFAETAIRLLAIEIAATGWTRPARRPGAAMRRDPRLKRALDYIEVHLAENIALIDIARAAGLSPTQLSHLFRRETGSSPYSFVIGRRVDRAAGLLRHTDMPLAEVAIASGFADQGHMTRVFRSRVGRTPLRVRRDG